MRGHPGRLVYFLKPVGMPGPIKIGVTSSPKTRLAQCMAWSPVALEIMATFDGGHEAERRVHDAFLNHHSHAEWFHPAPELLALIAHVASGQDPRDIVDFSKPIEQVRGVLYKRPPRTAEHRLKTSYSMRFSHAYSGLWRDGISRPDRAEEIMRRWSPSRGDGVMPTPAELNYLEAVLADPRGMADQVEAAA